MRIICAIKVPGAMELCKMVGSPNLKLLYDIYHMQIMEGDYNPYY
jgi:hydroxypyruvate isomerase